MDESPCDVCGSHQMEPATLRGASVMRCGLCDHVQGDAELMAGIDALDEAEQRGLHPDVYPLVQALEQVPTFHVTSTSVGRVETSEFPFVFLRLDPGGLRDLERLLTSLEMANRTTQRRWVVECTLQRELRFVLRPRFWKAILEIDANDIREARSDFRVLAEILARDVQLGWWRD
ncbi:MAG: hypothetical protein P1V36_15850 [Planctomycetota bacterium]|nr:hypothetical protein [Planctomycetota bacterium]